MRSLKWRILVQVEGIQGRRELREVACFERPLDGAMPADFGLSLAEGHELLRQLQTLVTQDQIRAYDGSRRRCRHCGRYRRIKDWRARQFDTALGHVDVRVPRVVSCLCTPEPLDDKGEPIDLRFSECSIEPLLPGRTTPEVAYWCARKGASYPYRSAARQMCEMTGLTRFSHMRVRRETLRAGEFVEDRLAAAGWFARRHRRGASHLRVAIDGTVLRASPYEDVTKFEVVAGRIEAEDGASCRFACSKQSPVSPPLAKRARGTLREHECPRAIIASWPARDYATHALERGVVHARVGDQGFPPEL